MNSVEALGHALDVILSHRYELSRRRTIGGLLSSKMAARVQADDEALRTLEALREMLTEQAGMAAALESL